MILAIDSEVVILGGSLSEAYSFYEKDMKSTFHDFLYPMTIKNLEIKVSTLSNMAVLGAAALILNENEQ